MKIKLNKFTTLAWVSVMAAFSLTSCDLAEKPVAPTWTTTIQFPLVSVNVNLNDLEDQDNIVTQIYNQNGVRNIFAYSDTTTMDSQEVGDQLAFGDITKSFAQSVDDVSVTGSTINQSSGFEAVGVDPIEEIIQSELGPIELADIPATSTEPFQLNEIFPDVNLLVGQNTDIPSGDLEPVQKPFTFTDFSSATFESGSLDISINNQMVIYLGDPITITLKEVNGTDTTAIPGGVVSWDTAIPPNTVSSRSLDLAGMTLPGEILVEVTGSTIGTDGNVILIDNDAITSSFNIDISGANLVVTSATAKVPSQTIDESGNIALADSENKIQEAMIKAGSLSIAIDNSMAVASELTITITSLVDPGSTPFTTVVQIPANETVADITDISGYSLVMAVDQQEVAYSYTIETEDTGVNFATLDQTDEVTVTITLYGDNVGEQLFFDSITGIIEPQDIQEAGEISISSESKLLNADISSGSIAINIDNQVNKPGFDGLPTIVLTIPELVDASSNPLTGSVTLQPSPTANTLNFDLSDYTLVFPDTATQVLSYTTQVTTPQGEIGSFGLEDSIIVDIVVSDMEFASVTGFFTQDAMVDSNEISLNEETKLLEAIFERGDFALSMTNRIGVVADVEFQIDEFIHRSTNQPLSMAFRLENTDTPQVNSLDLSEYKLAFDNALPGQGQGIHYVSTVSLPSDEEMTLTFGDSILIDVNITNLAMESVSGIIAQDTLFIEPTEQVIDMPDQVADLMFERVNIDIDFNSTFEIPIELSLTLMGTDSLGNTETINIQHSLTPEDDVVHIDAASILNIHPASIVASGQAIIGDGVSTSTIAKGQAMTPVMYINVPLSLIINDPDPIDDIASTEIASPLPEDQTVTLENVVLFAEVTNLFEFGASVVVLASNDSLAFDTLAIQSGTNPMADTLFVLEVLPLENASDAVDPEVNEIALTSSKLEMFQQDLYLKPEVKLLGRTDASGNPLPSRLFSTDSMTIETWGSISFKINGEAL